MALFNLFGKKSPERSSPMYEEIHTGGQLVKEDFAVVGVQYHADSLKRIASTTDDWKKGPKKLLAEGKATVRIFRYTYLNKPVRIEPDEKGIYDKNALMVLIAGEHVGYISEHDLSHVKSILATTSVKYITASITGGDSKIISTTGEETKSSARVRTKVRIAYAAP